METQLKLIPASEHPTALESQWLNAISPADFINIGAAGVCAAVPLCHPKGDGSWRCPDPRRASAADAVAGNRRLVCIFRDTGLTGGGRNDPGRAGGNLCRTDVWSSVGNPQLYAGHLFGLDDCLSAGSAAGHANRFYLHGPEKVSEPAVFTGQKAI